MYLLFYLFQDNHPDVAESAVVGFPHDIKGEGGSREPLTENNDATTSASLIISLNFV